MKVQTFWTCNFKSLLCVHTDNSILFYSILFYSILSHNLGRSSGHHRWICNNPFPSWPVFSCPSWAGKVHFCPLFDIVFPPLILSASFSFSFHCALYGAKMVWPCLKVFWFSKDNPTGHSERKKKKRQTEEEVGGQYQRVDRNGLCQLN